MDDNKGQLLDLATSALTVIAIAGFIATLVSAANFAISARIIHVPNVVRIVTAWRSRIFARSGLGQGPPPHFDHDRARDGRETAGQTSSLTGSPTCHGFGSSLPDRNVLATSSKLQAWSFCWHPSGGPPGRQCRAEALDFYNRVTPWSELSRRAHSCSEMVDHETRWKVYLPIRGRK